MSFPRYPHYKASGVEWLGEVPEHWAVLRGSLIGTLFGSEQVPEESVRDEGDLPFIKVSSMSLDSFAVESWDWFVDRAVAGQYRVRSGYIVFPKRGAAIFSNKVNIVERPSLIDPNLMGWTIGERATPKFVAYALKCRKLDELADVSTVPQINNKHIAPERFPVPPRDEQLAIATFLDRETAKIDALVAEQQRLIELLKEKRQAVISHAVTKGLDPTVPMKPSGIEWLGEVPEHWTISALKWLTQPDRPIMYGIVLPGPDVGDGVPILKGGNVKPSRMNLESMARTTPEIEEKFARARLREGDLVYAIRGTIGDCEKVPQEMEGSNITQDVARVAIDETNCATWARWALLASAIQEDLACGSLGAAVRGINIFDLKRVKIPTPPPAEQREISAFLDRETLKLEELTAEAQRAIDLLQERRTALISAAVTGQIDVRQLAQGVAA